MRSCPLCSQENPDGARFCLGCGSELGAPEPERRKLATLLFCDVSGSTAMGERVDAESVRNLMFRFFHTMRDAIERHGGTVEKFVGDAVMAVFGVPVAREDDALRAVRAAWEMQERIPELNEELERRFGTRLALRIGVNTGEVVAGDVSSRQMLVTGDAVNVAARLEQHARPGEVLLGEPTFHLVRGAVTVERVEPIAAKGKTEPIPAYRLLSLEAVATPSTRRLDAPFVGRDAELGRLRSTWDDVVTKRKCHLVTVVGEPGVGKSRLARELVAALGGDATAYQSRCLAYGEGITYWPIAEIIRRAAAIRDEDSAETAKDKLAALVAGDDKDESVAQAVAQAIGLAAGQVAAEEIAWAIRRLVVALALERPLVLTVDDIQWAEPFLLDLLAGLPSLEVPLLCVCLARPELLEEHPEWQATMLLERLSAEDAAALVPPELASIQERIVRTAGGNPLFVEELVAFIGDDAHAALPLTLSALLGARLDRLPPDERIALERGSVEGELFHRGAVAALGGEDVTTPLDQLRRKDFIRPAQAEFVGEAAFAFRHILIRDAAYASLTKKVRAELHERFADWLAQKASERLGEVEEILGYHLEQAYRYRTELGPVDERARTVAARASEHLATSGFRALDRGDVAAAAGLLERSLALAPEEGATRRELMYRLGDAHSLAGHDDRARELRRLVLEEARAAGDQRLELRLDVAEAEARFLLEGGGGPAEELTGRVIPELAELGDDLAIARAWSVVGQTGMAAGRHVDALSAFERALVHAQRAGDVMTVDDVAVSLVNVLGDGPTPVTEALERADAFMSGVLGRLGTVGIGAVLGFLLAMRGRLDETRALHAQTRAEFEEMGIRAIVVRALAGEAELLAGDPELAERELAAAWDLVSTGHQAIPWIGERRARALRELGRIAEAQHFLEFAERHASPIKGELIARAKATKALIQLDRGKTDAAVADALEAERLSEPFESPPFESPRYRGEILLAVAQVLRAVGRPKDAAQRAIAAVKQFERKGDVVSAKRARELVDDLEIVLRTTEQAPVSGTRPGHPGLRAEQSGHPD